MKSVFDIINSEIPNDQTIVLAISGGPDSMALFNLLMEISETKKFRLVCAHVNHKVRSESDEEEKKLREFFQNKNVIFESTQIDIEINDNFHNEARKIRYDFFNDVLNKYNSNFLLTAHHGDDLLETILMRIVRGSTLKGYAGFKTKSKSNNIAIIRPLIKLEKQDILNYCEKHEILFFNDSSNEKDDYFRNRIRKRIIPILKSENPKIVMNTLKFSDEVNDANDFIEGIAKKEYENVVENNILKIKKFNELHSVIKKQVLRIYLLNNYGDNINKLGDCNIRGIIAIINSSKPNLELNLPYNKKIVRSYDKLFFEEEVKKIVVNDILDSDYNSEKFKIFYNYQGSAEQNNDFMKLDSREVKLPLHIRNRENGDKIKLKGGGTKKVKDILIDKKVPLIIRKNVIVIVDSKGDILWIPGLYKSKYDKKISEKYDIILKYAKKD